MRGLFTLASAVTVATLWVVACSSSSDMGAANTGGSGASGGSGGSGGGAADVQCLGSYADLTQSAFSAQLKSSGSCISSSDATAICGNDVTKAAEDCGGSCFKTGGDAAAQDACTKTCLEMLTPTPSSACLDCYVADVGCARTNCLLSCGLTPTSQACADCRDQNGCVTAFYGCSGLPLPAGTAPGTAGASG